MSYTSRSVCATTISAVFARNLLAVTLCWVCGPGLAKPPPAAQTLQAQRQAEMASCQPGEISSWGDGRDQPAPPGGVQLVYQHSGAPAWFDEGQVRQALQRAATAWSGCGVPAILRSASDAAGPNDVRVAWSDAGTRGNFALADVGQRRLWLSAGMFALLAERNPRHPATETLQMTISHEMGHFFGLMAHSRRCIDVMSYYHDGKGQQCHTRHGGPYTAATEYRALLPTACDIARCRAVNAGR